MRPQPLALRTRSVGAVEAERARLQLLIADFAVGACIKRAEQTIVPNAAGVRSLFVSSQHQPVAVLNRQIDRFGDAGTNALAHYHAIDDSLDVMRFLRDQRGRRVDIDQLAVNTRTEKT